MMTKKSIRFFSSLLKRLRKNVQTVNEALQQEGPISESAFAAERAILEIYEEIYPFIKELASVRFICIHLRGVGLFEVDPAPIEARGLLGSLRPADDEVWLRLKREDVVIGEKHSYLDLNIGRLIQESEARKREGKGW